MRGLTIPWDVTFTPDRTMLVTERPGRILARLPNGTVRTVTAALGDLFVGSESGLMGIVTDPAFATNRRFYTCQAYRGTGTSPIDIRVVRWSLSAGATSATRVGSPVVTGLPITSGRHGGCRLRFAPDGTLHIGTGDAAVGTNPQNLASLGGKTLRVRPDGSVPSDNPFYSRGGRAALVWTYGHRNVQGMASRPGISQMWQVEHGTSVDDEVNLLVRGGNYGWDPVPGYDESTPMTDLTKFPTAQRAKWSSGPTGATSGAGFLKGSPWASVEGWLAVAELQGSKLRLFETTLDGRIRSETLPSVLNGTYGRLRAAQLGPDGALYLTTSNGSDDKVLRVVPTPPTPPAYRPGLDISPSGVALARRGASVTAFARGTDSRILATTQSQPGATWTPFAAITSGTVASAPAAVSWGGSRIDVFARGADNHLLHSWTDGGAWAPWQDLGGAINSAPAVTSSGVNRLDVAARGSGDAVYLKSWNGTRWSAWRSLGGPVASAPALRVSGPGLLTASAVGRDGRVYELLASATGIVRSWSNIARTSSSAPAAGVGGWVFVTRNGPTPVLVLGERAGVAIGGSLTSAPAALVRTNGVTLVVGRGSDNALWAWDGRAGVQAWSRVGGSLR
jgi:glucose/arabinose dehydrogenase